MKRSNRLILLIGFFLAIVAFVEIILLMNQTKETPPPTTTTVVTAAADIPLGTVITAQLVTTTSLDIADFPAGAFKTPGEVIGQTVRTDVKQGQYITATTFIGNTGAITDITPLINTGLRAMAVQVDQVSGVGTLIKPGDRVDLVLGISGADKFPIITIDPQTGQVTPVSGLNSTSVKSIIQNLPVLGTLLPPVTAQQGNQGGESTGGETTLNGQQQIVILAVTAQQSEVIKFAELDGTITLVLRSPKDVDAPADDTTGITLRQLVDRWNVIPPQIVETVLPKATAKP